MVGLRVGKLLELIPIMMVDRLAFELCIHMCEPRHTPVQQTCTSALLTSFVYKLSVPSQPCASLFFPARFCDRVMAAPSRTVADKLIMVSSLEQAIDATLDHFGSRNIDEYLDNGLDQTQWRATPNGKHMSSLAFMVDQFIGTGGCTNGVIPTKKLQQALEARNAAKK